MPSPMKSTNAYAPQFQNIIGVIERHTECSICMTTLYNASSCVPCLHTFCAGCIARWIEKNNGKCPMCRVSVIDLSPNWVMRDIVYSYLQAKPELQRSKEEKKELDKAELGYTLKCLGSTDQRVLYVESLSSLRSAPESGNQKYAAMRTRAVELFKKLLNSGDREVPIEIIKQSLDILIHDLNKELFPARVFVKYHRLERAYMHMLRISIPALGPAEHSSLGNLCFNATYHEHLEGYSGEFDEGDDFDMNMPERIEEAMNEMRYPMIRKPPRAMIDGFDPVELQALARVQNMRAPGFVRTARYEGEEPPRAEQVRTRRSSNVRAHRRSASNNEEPPEFARLTRAMLRDLTINQSASTNRPRRSARLAARNGEQPL